MRKVIIIILLTILVIPTVSARRPRVKAGKVADGIYTDKKYNFMLTFIDGWKYKIKANKDHNRVILTQLNYEIPPDYMDAPNYTLIPRMVIYADTTSLNVSAFLDSLLNENFKSKQKKEIVKEFEILGYTSGGSSLTLEKMVSRRRKTLSIAGERGIIWNGQVQYRNEVAVSASSLGAKRVYGAYGAGIIGVKKANVIVLVLTSCEWMYFNDIFEQAKKVISTLEWIRETVKKKEK